jgi:hypothetical protein
MSHETLKARVPFFAVIIVSFLVRCRSVFYTSFEPEILLEEYANSTLGRGLLSDDKLYTLAGWMYVKGASPNTINFEHPPLAKYMIGFSELAFRNPAIFGLIVSVFTLLAVYLISRKVVTLFPITLIPSLLLSLDKMYIEFSSTSMLDIYATFFAVITMLLLLLNEKKWARPLLYVAMGLALSCKWTTAFLIVLPPIYYALKGDWRGVRSYPAYLLIAALTYTATYATFFLAGNNIQDFIGLQYQMLSFHQNRRFQIGGPPPLWILLNFLTGIEGPTQIQTLLLNPENRTVTVIGFGRGLSLFWEYNPLTWPISFSGSLLALYYGIKENRQVAVIPMAFLLLLASVSVGKPFIWYLLPGMPFAFISFVYMINRFYIGSGSKKVANVILALYLASVAVWSLFVNVPFYITT